MPHSVIIVDDAQFSVDTLSEFLTQQDDFEVVATGTNGNEAIQLYNEYKPDLLLIDITMPQKSGLEAIIEIISVYPDARIILISARSEESILECMTAGARSYVEKPLKFRDPVFIEDFLSLLRDSLK